MNSDWLPIQLFTSYLYQEFVLSSCPSCLYLLSTCSITPQTFTACSLELPCLLVYLVFCLTKTHEMFPFEHFHTLYLLIVMNIKLTTMQIFSILSTCKKLDWELFVFRIQGSTYTEPGKHFWSLIDSINCLFLVTW